MKTVLTTDAAMMWFSCSLGGSQLGSDLSMFSLYVINQDNMMKVWSS